MFGLMLQVGSFSFNNLLQQLEDLGFFQYVLPFLLIFAVVYALISQIKVFKENKGAAVLIAIAIGLLALQLGFVSAFFQTLFPKVGIGVAILLIALILAGAFIPDEKSYKWIFFGIGMAVFFIILVLSISDWQFIGSWWWQQYGALVIVALVIITAMIMVIVSSKNK